MTDLSDLYQEVILDHNKKPRNKGEIENPTGVAEGHNPLCGDQIKLTVLVKDGLVEEVRFTGCGCAISTASASIMTEAVKGKKLEEVESLFHKFHDMVTEETDKSSFDEMDSLSVFSGVREYPARVKCATLAWHTLREALEGGKKVASTE